MSVATWYYMYVNFCSLDVDRCVDSKETGLCKMSVPRWHFNNESNKCDIFTYGGCGGNKNNFFTKAECLMACDKGKKNQ